MAGLIGKRAPAFPALLDQDGKPFDIAEHIGKGQNLCIFFYPAALTMGCTKEACGLRDLSSKPVFSNAQGSQVMRLVGISSDTAEKQKKFVDKHQLNYTLLADTEQEARKAYGVNGSAMFGISVQRVTFIIDKSGMVRAYEDSNINMSAHSKLVEKWAGILASEA